MRPSGAGVKKARGNAMLEAMPTKPATTTLPDGLRQLTDPELCSKHT